MSRPRRRKVKADALDAHGAPYGPNLFCCMEAHKPNDNPLILNSRGKTSGFWSHLKQHKVFPAPKAAAAAEGSAPAGGSAASAGKGKEIAGPLDTFIRRRSAGVGGGGEGDGSDGGGGKDGDGGADTVEPPAKKHRRTFRKQITHFFEEADCKRLLVAALLLVMAATNILQHPMFRLALFALSGGVISGMHPNTANNIEIQFTNQLTANIINMLKKARRSGAPYPRGCAAYCSPQARAPAPTAMILLVLASCRCVGSCNSTQPPLRRRRAVQAKLVKADGSGPIKHHMPRWALSCDKSTTDVEGYQTISINLHFLKTRKSKNRAKINLGVLKFQLATDESVSDGTGKNIATFIHRRLFRFSLLPRQDGDDLDISKYCAGITSDNGSSEVNAIVKHLKAPSQTCAAHSYALMLKAALGGDNKHWKSRTLQLVDRLAELAKSCNKGKGKAKLRAAQERAGALSRHPSSVYAARGVLVSRRASAFDACTRQLQCHPASAS